MRTLSILTLLLAVVALAPFTAPTHAASTTSAAVPSNAPNATPADASAGASLEELLGIQPSVEAQVQDCLGQPRPFCVCPAVYDPVCGCNGVTYDNACYARCFGVKEYTDGACI